MNNVIPILIRKSLFYVLLSKIDAKNFISVCASFANIQSAYFSSKRGWHLFWPHERRKFNRSKISLIHLESNVEKITAKLGNRLLKITQLRKLLFYSCFFQ